MDMESDDLEWLYDEDISNIQHQLEQVIRGFEGYAGEWLNRYERIIGSVDIEYFDHDNREWDIMTLYVTSEVGYYEGAMIDVYMDNIEGRSYSKTVQRKIDGYIRKIERTLTEYTMPLRRVATFSNGETIYEQA